VLPFGNCHSTNDILREVDSRRLLNNDFILIDNVGALCSSNLANQLKEFGIRLKQSKNNVLTILYTPVTPPTDGNTAPSSTIVGYESSTGKLLSFTHTTGVGRGGEWTGGWVGG